MTYTALKMGANQIQVIRRSSGVGVFPNQSVKGILSLSLFGDLKENGLPNLRRENAGSPGFQVTIRLIPKAAVHS